MSITAEQALGASKKYTNESIAGGGAIKGKNCIISSIVQDTENKVTKVTFNWTLDNGTEKTDTMNVPFGEKGDKGDQGDLSNLKPGDNIQIVQNEDGTYTISATGDLSIDYEQATNKPSINGVELSGNKTTEDLGIEVKGKLSELEDVNITDIAQDDFLMWDENAKAFVNKNMPTIPSKTSDLINDDGFITEDDIPEIPAKVSELDNDSKFQTETEVNEKIAEVELVKIPNVTIFGNPNIQHGQVTNFSATNFVQMPFEFDMTDKAFDFIVCFTPYATSGMPIVNTEEDTGGMMITSKSTGITVNVFDKDNNQLVTSSIPLTVEINKTYFVKVSWNKLQYIVSHSVDGGNTYVIDTTTPSAVPPGPCHLAFGRKGTLFLNGSINLNKCELYINGFPYWEGMDDVGMATRLATDLANITEDGIEKINDIISTNYVNKTAVVKAFNTTTTDTNIPSEKLVKDSLDAIEDKVDKLQLYKFPNAIIIGDPAINNGQISNFSSSDYLKFPFLVDFKNKPFEINMAFTTGTNVTTQENIFDSDFGLAFAIRSGHFVVAISSNGTNWNIGEGVGTHNIEPNTAYRVKLAWDGSQYTLDYSTNGGESYTRDITKASAEQPYPKQIFIGVGQSDTTVLNHFTGIINMNRAELAIDGTVRWQGMDDVGLATRLATDVSNVDEAGIEKIKEYAETNNIKQDLQDLSYNEIAGGKNLASDILFNKSKYVLRDTTWSYVDVSSILARKKFTASMKDNPNLSELNCGFGTDSTVDPIVANRFITSGTIKSVTYDFSTSDTVYLFVATAGGYISTKLTKMLDALSTRLQVEVGDSATDYKPFIKSNATLTDEISRKELELAELQVLGWNVPNEMPIKNTLVNGVLTQNIGRVDLGSLNWYSYSSANVYYANVPNIKSYRVDPNVRAYSFEYAYISKNYSNLANKECTTNNSGLTTNPVIILKDLSMSSTANLSGKYLYYELATPITHTVPDTEGVSAFAKRNVTTNLLKPSLASTTIGNIQCINNGDGTFTFTTNGQPASQNVTFEPIGIIKPTDKVCKVVGCPSGGSSTSYYIKCANYDDTHIVATDYGNGVEVSGSQGFKYKIVIVSGTVCNNLVFKPMLTTDLSADYDDFIPYTGDTGTLNGDVAEIRKSVDKNFVKILKGTDTLSNILVDILNNYMDNESVVNVFIYSSEGRFGGYISRYVEGYGSGVVTTHNSNKLRKFIIINSVATIAEA